MTNLFHRLMFIGACVLLGALIACGHATSYILAIAGFIIISVSLGGLIVKSIQAKDIKLLFHGIDSDYSWAGFFILLTVVLMNHDLSVLAVISGLLAIYHLALLKR